MFRAVHRLPHTSARLMKHAGVCGSRWCGTCKAQAVDFEILYFEKEVIPNILNRDGNYMHHTCCNNKTLYILSTHDN